MAHGTTFLKFDLSESPWSPWHIDGFCWTQCIHIPIPRLEIQVAGPKPYMIQAGLRLLYVYLVMYFQFRNLMLNHQTNQHRPNPH